MEKPADSKAATRTRIIVGRVCGIHGVAGWLKILSFTRPRINIFKYRNWLVGADDEWENQTLLEGKQQGKGLIIRIEGLSDRETARQFIGKDIAVYRDELPKLDEGEYYWIDLIGLTVIDKDGKQLGTVSDIRETGANDVLVVTGKERQLIPLVFEKVVIDIDLQRSNILVDWDPRYL